MISKKTTIDDLARMITDGFDNVDKQFEGVGKQFKGVNERFDKVENRLGNIEHILSSDYKRRIEKLEMEMRELKNALAM